MHRRGLGLETGPKPVTPKPEILQPKPKTRNVIPRTLNPQTLKP